ncbi:hypothetical protein [Poriferisphaera sp. WC338]|uniref:hypothetical protein n=1 Tax=Poriferisphaera sp. WC338 TaxID=3425129 RepID=UPI003D8190BF
MKTTIFTVFFSLVLLPWHTGASTLHPESTFGDFADTDSVPASELGVFGIGMHIVAGTFGDDGNNNDDGDVFTFTIPTGTQLTSINLTTYTTTGDPGGGSFFAIAIGKTVGTTMQTAGNHLSNMLVSETGELLDDLAAGAMFGSSALTAPLSAGDYAIFLHETSTQVDFALSFDVQSIPEPASISFGLGSLVCLLLKRRSS